MNWKQERHNTYDNSCVLWRFCVGIQTRKLFFTCQFSENDRADEE